MIYTGIMLARFIQLLEWIYQLANFACDVNGFSQKNLTKLHVENPNLELCITCQGFAIFESESKVAFQFSNNLDKDESDYSTKMIDLLCPDWAISRYIKTT